MYASLTTSTVKGPVDNPTEVAAMAGETLVSWLREIDGYQGLLMLWNGGAGTVHVITFWHSREVADRHLEARMRLRDLVTEKVSVEVEQTEHCEVVLARLGALMGGAETP